MTKSPPKNNLNPLSSSICMTIIRSVVFPLKIPSVSIYDGPRPVRCIRFLRFLTAIKMKKTRHRSESFHTLNLYLMKKIITQKCGAKLQLIFLHQAKFFVKNL